jgi:hypothetical protein
MITIIQQNKISIRLNARGLILIFKPSLIPPNSKKSKNSLTILIATSLAYLFHNLFGEDLLTKYSEPIQDAGILPQNFDLDIRTYKVKKHEN